MLITHPEKLLFPADGISKGELAKYYEEVAPLMLPHLRGRPVTMERYPAGIAKKGFIQKDVSKGFPEWLERVEVPKKGGTSFHPLANDLAALLWIANQNSITLHVWTSRVPELIRPDLCVIDLDPSLDDPEALRRATLLVRRLLDEFELPSSIKTSGSKGFHIVVALDGRWEFDRVWQFAHALGALLVKRHPETFTQEFIKADREGRILVDTGRNGYGATFAAVYAVRPQPGAPVSAPCTWAEVERGAVAPRSFTLRNMPERLAEVGDLWSDLPARPVSLEAPFERLRSVLTEADLQAAHAASVRKPKARKQRPGDA